LRAVRESERPKPAEQPVISQTRDLDDILRDDKVRRLKVDT
jgi:hypothetical protein